MVTPKYPTGGRIKGAPFRALLEYCAEARSLAEVRAAIATLTPAEERATCPRPDDPGFGLLASGWYSSVGAGKLVGALWDNIPAHERDDFTDEVAKAVMSRTLHTVHKAVFRVVGSPALMKRYPMVFWGRQYDTGDVHIDDVDDRAQRHTYKNWAGHHPVICSLTFRCVPVMFEAMGLTGTRITIERCAGDGVSRDCSAVVRWDG